MIGIFFFHQVHQPLVSNIGSVYWYAMLSYYANTNNPHSTNTKSSTMIVPTNKQQHDL